MSNLFDNLQDKAFDTTLSVMGYDASWVPVATPESEAITARVHFKDPNEKMELAGVEYTPVAPFIEYRLPSLPGLYESVRGGTENEVVTVNGIQYYVRMVEKLYDGKTFKAYLQVHE